MQIPRSHQPAEVETLGWDPAMCSLTNSPDDSNIDRVQATLIKNTGSQMLELLEKFF
jgi:hypothetical protein